MRKKVIDLISGVSISAGLFLIIGAVGSSDLEVLTETEVNIRIIAGIILTGLGAIGVKIGGKYYV